MFYPSLVIAILAAIVASQTMITATFQVGYVMMKSMKTETAYADSDAVAFANHQIIVLSSNQSETHFEDLLWANLHSLGELAPHGWHDMCDCSVQQRKISQTIPLACFMLIYWIRRRPSLAKPTVSVSF